MTEPARLVIVLNDVDAAGALVPLRYAATAAAMDVAVEVHCVGASAAWLREGAAGDTLLAQIRQAVELEAQLFACPQALAACAIAPEELIAEVAGVRGAAALLAAGLARNARFMNF
jgi:predicted peroxiredoxin